MTGTLQRFFNYIQYEKRLSSHTMTAYHNDIFQFSDYLKEHFEGVEIANAQSSHIRSWIIYRIENKDNPRTINRKISALKSLYKFMLQNDLIVANPTAKTIRPKTPKRLPKDIAQPKLFDLKDILESELDREDYTSYRDYTLFLCLYLCGLRRSELIDLTWAAIDSIRKTISVYGKGKKQRIIPIKSELLSILLDYKSVQRKCIEAVEANHVFVLDNGKKLYPNFVLRVVQKQLSRVTTQEQISPHALRHSFATHMLNEGADLNAIKELLGHSSLAATQVYTHNSIEKLKQIHKFSHPKS